MKLNKMLKWGLVALLLITVGLLVWGFVVGFESNGGQAVDVLFYWAYAMVALAVIAWVVVGGIVSATTDKKFLLKAAIVLVGIAAICAVAYVLAPGNPAVGSSVDATPSVLKLTDTILNLIYFAGGAAIVSIIVGEIRMAIANRK